MQTSAFTALSLMVLFVGLLATAARADDAPSNRVVNGGFERGEAGWMWQQWNGRPLPGYIDRDDMHEGLASFKLHEPGREHELSMAREVQLDADNPRNMVLSVALKAERMPEDAARVRVLIFRDDENHGWLNRETGRIDVINTGGNHDWHTFQAAVPASALRDANKLTVFIYHDKPGEGTLGIDALSLAPGGVDRAKHPATAEQTEPPPSDDRTATEQRPQPAAAPTGARPPLPAGSLETVNYTVDNLVWLAPKSDARLAIEASPDEALYRVGELPEVAVRHVAAPGLTLVYRVRDGFGNVLMEKSADAEEAARLAVELPENHGYYEIIASLNHGDEMLAEARRSVGVLPPPAEPVADEPFGLWIQGMEHYPELGVRWTRDGVSWTSHENNRDGYLEGRVKYYQWCQENDIRVLAYPKQPHPHHVSREVIADTPEAWRDLEAWWTQIVQTLGPHVDAWGVVNEPIAGHWEGSDELIMRYWRLMRKIVDEHDTGKPLAGPSLGLAPSNVRQYGKLLDMGFADLIDVVELHTYITSPEDMDLAGQIERIDEMTRQATAKGLPIWSTEHGSSGQGENELLQAQHLMRSWLVAKKIGLPVVIWHMFSHPQGSDMREIHFGIFRNTRDRADGPPQPRPAGLAYGVMTRQLAGAAYKTELDHLGPSINAYVFERDGHAMLALWTTSRRSFDVTLSADDQLAPTETGLFGRTAPLAVRDGLVEVTVDRNPKFIAPLPAHYLESEPIARLVGEVAALPGGQAESSLVLTNPTDAPAELRIEWLDTHGWRLDLPTESWALAGGESRDVALTAAAPGDAVIGRTQVYGRVLLDGRYVTPLAVPLAVLPQVEVADVSPGFEGQGPVLRTTLRRLDPDLEAATLHVTESDAAPTRVRFEDADHIVASVPVDHAAADQLTDMELVVRGSQDKVQSRERHRLSFVPAGYMSGAISVDGDLGDWPNLPALDDPCDVRWAWDEQHVYLAVRVAKQRHVQDEAITQMWKADSVQIGVAPGEAAHLVRPHRPGLQEADMMELDVALRPDGAAMYRHRTMNSHLAAIGAVSGDDLPYAVVHQAGVTTYEMRMPVEQLGLRPLAAGQVLRASVLVNINRGDGREMREWFGGIGAGKDPELFGHLVLHE